ncbi:MAG TPA: hypothetical protein PKK59_04675 [Anaerolineaceae bacterium]|nr:hypothetical protein [Anaerolineaceae bacterium]
MEKFEVVIYLAAGLIILVSARKTYLSWREWSSSIFGLEKEHSQQKFNSALTVLVFSVLLVIGLFVVNTFVTPAVPGVQQLATPTIDLTQQPPTITPAPTIVITGEGLIPTITSYFSRGCIPDQIDWTDPQNGDTINGRVELKGTVNVENLGFYKYEYSPSGSDTWTTIAAGNARIVNEPLGGAWDTRALVPGEYELRLVVNDNQNNPLPACVIQVIIEASE